MALGTPKEKANELVTRFSNEGSPYCFLNSETAVNCAIICVNNIIEALESHGKNFDILGDMDSEWRYWNEVKNEINHLLNN